MGRLDPYIARTASRFFHGDPAGQKLFDDPCVGQQVGSDARRAVAGAVAGKRERKQKLVGEVFVHGGRSGQHREQRGGGFFSYFFGRFARCPQRRTAELCSLEARQQQKKRSGRGSRQL